MADKESAKVAEESQGVKNLLSVLDAHGDSMSASDRQKLEGLIDKARADEAAKAK